MKTLDRKLIRDVVHLRGQVVAITLVVACGVASFVAMRSTYNSLLTSQQSYYETYRFADTAADDGGFTSRRLRYNLRTQGPW